MKTTFISLIGPFFSGSGVLSGVFWRETTTQFKTIEQVLEMENREILETNETTKDNEWFILAQKYQKASGKKDLIATFIDKGSFTISADEEKFSEYEILASKLKEECSKSLKKSYSFELYQNVLKWCRYKIPDYAKNVFDFQKNKKCILKIVRNFITNENEPKRVEWFIWNMLDRTHSSVRNRKIFSLNNAINNDIKENDCSEDKVLKVEYKFENKKDKWTKLNEDAVIF